MSSYSDVLIGCRRCRVELLANSVRALEENGCKKKILAEKVHMNYKQLNWYLGELIRLGLVETYRWNGRKLYRPSRKGKLYLKYFRNLKELLT